MFVTTDFVITEIRCGLPVLKSVKTTLKRAEKVWIIKMQINSIFFVNSFVSKKLHVGNFLHAMIKLQTKKLKSRFTFFFFSSVQLRKDYELSHETSSLCWKIQSCFLGVKNINNIVNNIVNFFPFLLSIL